MDALRTSRLIALAITALAVAGSAAAGTDVVVDSGSVVQNEISLTLVPGSVGQPTVLLAAYNDDPYPASTAGLGISTSTDGGANWSSKQLQFPTSVLFPAVTLVDSWDPTATADSSGNLYVADFSTDGVGAGVSGLYVHASTDSGVTWPTLIEVSADGASGAGSPPDANYRFNDRVQMTSDTLSSGSYAGNVYITWIKDRGLYTSGDYTQVAPLLGPPSDIYVSTGSWSAGPSPTLSFTAPTQINDTGTSDLANMPVPAVALDGDLYVSWLDYDVWGGGQGTIYLDRSTDGGVNWGTDTAVTTIDLPPLNVTTGTGAPDARAKGAPVLATSPTNANTLYIVYAADPDFSPLPDGPDEADIFLIKSTDGGATWGAAVRVNNDSTTNDQILPWIDVKSDGTIDIAWYDRRNDTGPLGDTLWDIYIARSTDGGANFLGNVQLNDTSFATPGGTWMGEYLGLAVDSSYAYVAFTSSIVDTTGGDIYFDKIANASIPEPGTMTLLACGGLALLWRRRR